MNGYDIYCPDKDTCKGLCGECKVRLRASQKETAEISKEGNLTEKSAAAMLPERAQKFFMQRFERLV